MNSCTSGVASFQAVSYTKEDSHALFFSDDVEYPIALGPAAAAATSLADQYRRASRDHELYNDRPGTGTSVHSENVWI